MKEKISQAVGRILRGRGYENHPSDEDLFDEAVEEVAEAVMAILSGQDMMQMMTKANNWLSLSESQMEMVCSLFSDEI